jgi:hypothetical protein
LEVGFSVASEFCTSWFVLLCLASVTEPHTLRLLRVLVQQVALYIEAQNPRFVAVLIDSAPFFLRSVGSIGKVINADWRSGVRLTHCVHR